MFSMIKDTVMFKNAFNGVCTAVCGLCLSLFLFLQNLHAADAMEIKIDHVMFPVYANDVLLGHVESTWKEKEKGRVYSQPTNGVFKGVYFQSKDFYVEYLSTVENQPYWSSAIYLVVDKKYWKSIDNPVMVNDHFLIPYFGSGYQLISPDYPHLTSKLEPTSYNGLKILISQNLFDEIKTLGGQNWTLPSDGSVEIHEGLHHLHDIVVIDENDKLVAPLYEANPILRDYF